MGERLLFLEKPFSRASLSVSFIRHLRACPLRAMTGNLLRGLAICQPERPKTSMAGISGLDKALQ